MGAGLSGPAILVIALIAIGAYLGGEVKHGAHVAAHQVKCGALRIVGKHCAPPPDQTDDQP